MLGQESCLYYYGYENPFLVSPVYNPLIDFGLGYDIVFKGFCPELTSCENSVYKKELLE